VTFPSDVDLDIIYHEAFHASDRSSDSTWSLDAISAVKRAVIEALAEEASGGPEALDMYDPGVFNAGSFIADWLRSHLADDHEPDVEGYTFLGRGRMHDNMPVYQKDSDSSLWIKTEGEMIPYSMTFDYTHGLGRVKG
jgi:hypothetical protein